MLTLDLYVNCILFVLSATDQLIRLHGVCNALPFKKFHVSVLNLVPAGTFVFCSSDQEHYIRYCQIMLYYPHNVTLLVLGLVNVLTLVTIYCPFILCLTINTTYIKYHLGNGQGSLSRQTASPVQPV